MEKSDNNPNFIVSYEKIVAHLKEKWGNKHSCPYCGNPNWEVDDRIYELKRFLGGDITAEYSYHPLIAIICTSCGNTVLLHTQYIGQKLDLTADKKGGKDE